MADLVNPTTNVSIYGGDNDPDRSAAVTVTTDGSKRLLDVSATVSSQVFPSGDMFHVLDRTSPVSFPVTLATHTVNTGKIFKIVGWRVNSEGAKYDMSLQIAGVEVDAIIQINSAFTSVGTGTVDYSLVPKEATAGQVIRIQGLSGDTSKEYITFFWGVEVDA